MNLSSIVVFTSADNVEVVQSCLCELSGIEVHHQCHDTGRLVVIQEAPNDEAEMDGLRNIKNLPHVLAAEMFYHYVDGENVDDDNGVALQHNDGGVGSWI